MAIDFSGKLVISISSRALFDLEASNQVWEEQGEAAYARYQIEHEDKVLDPGPAYHFIQKLLSLKQAHKDEALVEVILLSRNNADSGLRIFNSIKAHTLNITRAAFTRGQSPYRYVHAFGAQLFLSLNEEDVCRALAAGCAAASILPNQQVGNNASPELRIAFDGDAVLFSDEAERIFQQQDIHAFQQNEIAEAATPLKGGPFKEFLQRLHNLQQTFAIDDCPIRTALVTARNAPAHERAIRTLREWDIRTDEALFLGGLDKGEFLNAFGADIFFDDQQQHCLSASQHTTAGHVPHGVANETV